MPETAERRPLVSAFRIIDDSLEEVGIPGPFNLIPTPSEVVHFFGLPTLSDLGESMKARLTTQLSRSGPRLPRLPGL